MVYRTKVSIKDDTKEGRDMHLNGARKEVQLFLVTQSFAPFELKRGSIWAKLHSQGENWQPWQLGAAVLQWVCIGVGAEVLGKAIHPQVCKR